MPGWKGREMKERERERERVRVRVVWVCMDDDGVEKSKRLDGRCTTQ